MPLGRSRSFIVSELKRKRHQTPPTHWKTARTDQLRDYTLESHLFICQNTKPDSDFLHRTSIRSCRLSGPTHVKFIKKSLRASCSCMCLPSSRGASRARNTTAPSTKYRSTPVRMASKVEQRMATPPPIPNEDCCCSLPASALAWPESQLLQLKTSATTQTRGGPAAV